MLSSGTIGVPCATVEAVAAVCKYLRAPGSHNIRQHLSDCRSIVVRENSSAPFVLESPKMLMKTERFAVGTLAGQALENPIFGELEKQEQES